MIDMTFAGEIYGPDLGWDGLVPRLVVRLTRLRTEAESAPPVAVKLPLPGEPAARCRLVHIDDAIAALRLVAARGAPGRRYAVGGGEEIALGDLARRIARLLLVDVELVPGPPGGPAHAAVDGGELTALGWAPRVTVDAGLGPTVAWYSAHVHLAPPGVA